MLAEKPTEREARPWPSETVAVPGRDPFLLRDLAGKSGSVPAREIRAEFFRPGGPGPFPAVVISEGLGGLKDVRERSYGAFLAARGCAVLAVDSFGSRGHGPHGDLRRALGVSEAMMLADAFDGLAWLAARSDIDAARIHVIGFSYGGMIATLSAFEQVAAAFRPDGLRFAGHVSFYGCTIARVAEPRATGAPVTMMLGDRDGNTSIPRAEAIADDLRRGGARTEVIVFPGVFHQWDGDDATERWVSINLRGCRMRLDPDGEVREERTGLAMRGRTSRAALIALGMSYRGYTIKRDALAEKRSDAILLKSLGLA